VKYITVSCWLPDGRAAAAAVGMADAECTGKMKAAVSSASQVDWSLYCLPVVARGVEVPTMTH